eukprot:gene11748-5086_t
MQKDDWALSKWIQMGVEGEKFKPIFLRKLNFYKMGWNKKNFSLFDYVIAAAPFGGLIALTKDLCLVDPEQDKIPDTGFYIFSSDGKLISTFPNTLPGIVLRMCWNKDDQLVVFTSESTFHIITIDGTEFLRQDLPEELKEQNIIEIKVWKTGALFFTQKLETWLISNFDEPIPTKLPDVGLDVTPYWIEVRPNKYNCEVYFATQDSESVTCFGVEGLIDFKFTNGPFRRIAFSSNSKYIAFFSQEGSVWVIKSDLSENCCEFYTKTQEPPDQFCWCGDDYICCLWTAEQLEKDFCILLVIGLNGSFSKFKYMTDYVKLITENDGLRILTPETCDFIHRITDSSMKIFQLGSLEPGAILYDAYEDFTQQKSQTTKTFIKMKDKMTIAIQTCLDAALDELDVDLQKKLLTSASYGRTFTINFDNEKYIEASTNLKILNLLRQSAFPLTYKQYQFLTPEVIIDKLLNRSQHGLAYQICEYLKRDSQKVLIHWASRKLNSKETDEQIVESITSNFKGKSISFSYLAIVAFQKKRKELSILLLQNEEKLTNQIPVLVEIGEYKMALEKAIQTSQSDLIYVVVLTLLNEQPEYLLDLLEEPNFIVAKNLFLNYLRGKNNLETLESVYEQFDMNQSISSMYLKQSYFFFDTYEDYTQKIQTLSKIGDDEYPDKNIINQTIELLTIQRELKDKSYLHLSLYDTLAKLIENGKEELALKMKKRFKVTEKKYYHIKVKGLGNSQNFYELESFGMKKKPPSGSYLPIINEFIEGGQYSSAETFIKKLKDNNEKVECFLRME